VDAKEPTSPHGPTLPLFKPFFFSSAAVAAAAMEVNTEAEPLRDGATSQDHDREEGGHDIGGEAKRLREGNDDKDGESGRHQDRSTWMRTRWTGPWESISSTPTARSGSARMAKCGASSRTRVSIFFLSVYSVRM